MRRIAGLLLAHLAMASTPAHAATRHAFATSTLGSGNMHSWAEVAGTKFTGLAAADAVCRTRAALAGLENSAGYVAWLSDRNNDAYCRLFGLSGKKAESCGQFSLPVGAGPWLRTDGVPFADVIENALDAGVVYAPLNVDESGQHFLLEDDSYTATGPDGAFSTQFGSVADCHQWTSAVVEINNAPELGSNLSTGAFWTAKDAGVSCDQSEHLICLEQGAGSPLTGHAQFGRREAFVSSADVSGDLGGIAGADALCQSLAGAAGLDLPGSFKALLASSAPASGVTDRFQFDGPWFRRDGLLFAHDKAELIGGAVTLPLNVTELGTYVAPALALTGATRSGLPIGLDCGNWTLAADAGVAEAALTNSIVLDDSSGGNWLSAGEIACGGTPLPGDFGRKIMCLSDSDVIFHDAYEPLPESP